MEEIGIESTMVEAIRSGEKTMDARLGTQKYLRIQEGDILSVREDFWYEGKVLESLPHSLEIEITQILYFESFEELCSVIDYQAAVPGALSPSDAVKKYKEFYDAEDERSYGAIAFTFELVSAKE